MSDPLTSMIEALGLEIAAIRKKGGGAQIELRGGELIGQAEGSWLYRFVVFEDLYLRDDTPVRVVAGEEEVSGVVVSFKDGVLIVALESDLGPKIASARLISNDSFLVERLKERLEQVRSGEAQFARNSAERAIGSARAANGDGEPDPTVLADGVLNAEQVAAVRRSLGSDTTFVWGPPGTGKTTTVARIVEAHYRAGRAVLLVSNTNIAVDTALEHVADRLRGEPEFHEGLVIRQGPVVKPELRQRFGPQVILEDIVARLGESLQREKEQLAQEAAPLEREEGSLQSALEHLEQLAHARTALSSREAARAATRSSIAAREREAEQHRAGATRLRSDLARARGMGALRRFFSGLDPERLEREAVAAERAARAAQEAAAALATDLPKLEAEITSLRSDVERIAFETRSYSAEPQIRARLSALRERLKQIRERIAAIGRELAELEQQVLARCRILATTVYRTYLGKASRQFDVVVVDEASMLMPPLVYYAAGLATQSVVIAGDFRQLSPIVVSEEVLAGEWLKRDAFELATIPQRLERGEEMPHLVALATQYRMRGQICAVINELFYRERPLKTDPSANRVVSRFPLGPAALLYVDTGPFHPWTAHRRRQDSDA